jgi:hypothetical protein
MYLELNLKFFMWPYSLRLPRRESKAWVEKIGLLDREPL